MTPKKVILISSIVLVVLIYVVLQYIVPAPPKKIVIATGGKSGQYYRLGQDLKSSIEKNGIQVEVLETKGSVENLKLLNTKDAHVDIALVQSGTATNKEFPEVESLAGVFYEPLWVVYDPKSFLGLGRQPDKISDLINKNISIGALGSGTYQLVEQMFLQDHVAVDRPNFYAFNYEDSLKKLKDHSVDAIFLSINHRADIMQRILKDPELKIMSFTQAYGYPPRIRGISVIQIHRGVLNITTDSPDRDILLPAATAEIVALNDLHPAITSLIIDAADDMLSGADILNPEKTFPSPNHLSFEPNDDAQKYMRDGPSFLHRYLPFWVAVWADRLLRVIIPLLAILIPLFNFLPAIIVYRTKAKFAKVYKELREIEKTIKVGGFDKGDINQDLDRLSELTKSLKVPQFNSKDTYDLLAHIDDVKKRIK
jgi:hypothetical protein